MTVKVSSLTSAVNRHMSDDRPQRILRPEEYQRRLEREFARRYVVMVQANRRRTLAVQNGTSASTAPLIPRLAFSKFLPLMSLTNNSAWRSAMRQIPPQ